MKKIVVFLLTFSFLCFLVGCNGGKTPGENSDSSSEETITIGNVEKDVFEIKTEYCTLKYPSKWKDMIEVTFSENTVFFKDKESGTPVFDIIFKDGEGYLLGTLDPDGENVAVRVLSHDFENSLPNYDSLCQMQADINVLINHLSKDYTFIIGD